MWEPNGSAIMSDNVWDLLLADFLLEDFAEFELAFFLVNSMWKESSFGVNKHSETFISPFNSNHVHLTQGESVVSSDFAVNLNHSFLVPAYLL